MPLLDPAQLGNVPSVEVIDVQPRPELGSARPHLVTGHVPARGHQAAWAPRADHNGHIPGPTSDDTLLTIEYHLTSL